MRGLFRHAVVFCGSMAAGFVVYHLAVGMGGVDASPARAILGADPSDLLGSGYHLSDLKLSQRVTYYITEKYVEPGRVQPSAMFDAALDAVERRVDSVLLRRQAGGKLLHISVGSYNTTLTLEPIATTDDLLREMGKVARVLEDHIDDPEIKLPEVEYALINGMLSTLDPHSVLMPPEISREMDVENQGEFGGLGITITLKDGRLTVEYPLEDTPAWRAGIKPQDRIVRIEGESTINMELDEAVSKLRGPVGEPVTITVMRDMFDEPRDFRIVRDLIRINPVEGQVLEGGVCYLRIKSFHERTSQDMDTILAGFRRDLGGVPKGLILDLRGNPGGFLNQAVEVSNRFLSNGVVVATVTADGKRDVDRAEPSHTEPDYPVIVLTDANSASASEIVAGALKNRDRAMVVGERTFGKGSVQHLYSNADDSKLKLTVAQYLTPGDRSIQSIGIPPDVETVSNVVQMRESEDSKGHKKPPEPLVSLLWRERLSREADLDHHLEFNANQGEKPAYRIDFLENLLEDEERKTGKRDLSRDWQVQLAREILLRAGSSRRADLVEAAGAVVERRRAEEQERIRKAFADLKIDWTAGEQPASPALSIALDLGEDRVLTAGQEEEIKVLLTNNGTQPVYQAFATTDSKSILADGEFFFGLVPPGRTVAFKKKVTLADGYPDEEDRVTFRIRDARGTALGESQEFVRTRGAPPTRYGWSMVVHDNGTGTSKGDGDGLPEVGEVVDVEIRVTNASDVAGHEATAKVRNHAGRDLDLRNGVVDLGDPAPKATVTGRFSLEVRGTGDKGWIDLELQLGDTRFDYGAIMNSGFYDYAYQKEKLRIPIGGVVPEAEARQALQALSRQRVPPDLSITRRPELRVQDPNVVLSGIIRDESGVRDVMVYLGEDKIFYQGAKGDLPALPFSVEASLKDGLNHLVVLAHDNEGFRLAREVNVYLDRPGAEPQVKDGARK